MIDGVALEALSTDGELLRRLVELDVTTADADTCVSALIGAERARAAVEGLQQQLLARLDQVRGCTRDNWSREEVAAALGVAPETAGHRLDLARTLWWRLRDTWQLLRDGAITGLHARALAEAVDSRDLSDEQLTAIQTWVLRVPDAPIGVFRARIRYALEKFAPQTTAQERDRARADRYAWHKPDGGETGTLILHGPADATMMAWTLIDDTAHQLTEPGDTRSMAQRRFDAFTDLFLGTDVWANVTASVEVTVPVDALQGGDTPGELVGYGPISAQTARQLTNLPHAQWRRLVYQRGTGHLVACGETLFRPGQIAQLLAAAPEAPPEPVATYRPSPRLARYVRARDRYCCFPGCRRAARRTHLDHTVRWVAGGATSADNLHPLCPRHHRLKHEAPNWVLRNDPDGSATWTAPTGRSYSALPHDYRGP